LLIIIFQRYNIGHIGISLGDLGLAYQAFKVSVSINSAHGEAFNNVAVLEMRRQKFDIAKSCLNASCEMCPHIFEPLFNSGWLLFFCEY
jgi:tetratricopeptide repeat protein 8